MALLDPLLGKAYERSEDMPYHEELEAFEARLGADATARVIDAINDALERVRVGVTIMAADLIPGRTEVWQPPYEAIYATCERTGSNDPYKQAALHFGQMVKAAIIDRANDWWSIWRTTELRGPGREEVQFAIYQRHGTARP